MAQPSPEFEKSFADLAYSYINQNAPKLLDFMVGFQVLEHDDDESRAVGVFGFSVGGKKKDMFYAPVFFLNGKLKGQELFYNGTSDLFMPMDEAWIDFILNKKPEMIGTSGEEGERSALSRYLPNFRDIMGKGMSKAATEMDVMGPSEIHGKVVMGEAFDLTPAMGMFTDAHKTELYKQAAADLDLEKLAKESPKLCQALEVRLVQYEEFAKYASAFHDFKGLEARDVDALKQRVKQAKTSALGATKEASEVYKDPEFLTDSDLCYTEAQKEEFVKHSYVVVDERKDTDKSGVIDGDLELSNPSEPGVYQIVFDDMSVKECLWLPSQDRPRDEDDLDTHHYSLGLLVDLKTKLEYRIFDTVISLTAGPISTLAQSGVLKELKSGATNNSGIHTPVYIVDENTGDYRSINNSTKIIESDRVSGITVTGNDSLCVAKGCCKLLRTRADWTLRQTAQNPLTTKVGISRVFDGLTTQVTKYADKWVFKAPETVKEASTALEAMKFLMIDQKLSKEAAEHVMSNVSDEPYDYFVKAARGPFDDYDPYAPMIDIDDSAGVEPYSGVRMTENVQQSVPVQGLLTNDGPDYGELEPDVFETMRRSVSTGQKEIFDLTALKSLIDVSDVDQAIDKQLPGIVTALDRVGRSLFLLYFHMKDFEDRYGKQELTNLEDTLKDALKTNGKLVLFLKKRSISQDIDDVEVEL